MDSILVLFARVPELGRVKTRLAPELGEQGALALHRAFLMDSLELLHRASAKGVQRAVWLSEPWTPDEVFEPLLRDCARGVQQGEDLGQRMQNCLTEHLALGFRRVVIIGADSPTLPLEILTSAFAALRDRDIVLGPSLDGGYYLMGARTVAPEMFRGITWGGPTVLRDTLRILKILGMAPVLLPQWYDVDTVEDLRRLAGDIMRLQEAGEPAPRATLKALAASLAGLVRGA